jgi:hypothetical protein
MAEQVDQLVPSLKLRRVLHKKVGRSYNDTNTDIRMCSRLATEFIRPNVLWNTKTGEQRTTCYEMVVPIPIGNTKSQITQQRRASKGLGEARIALKHLNAANTIMQQPHHEEFDYVGQGMYNHTIEEKCNEKMENEPQIDPDIAAAIGITTMQNERPIGKSYYGSYFGKPSKIEKVGVKIQ